MGPMPIIDDEAEFDLEPPDDGYHCSSCNRYISVDDGILAIVLPSRAAWATDYWRVVGTPVIPESRLVIIGLLHTDCQREWYLTVDANGDIYHGGACDNGSPVMDDAA